MKESDVNGALNAELKQLTRPVTVSKHSDRFLLGWPDTSVVWRGFSSYIEVKFPRGLSEEVHTMFRPLQLETLQELEVTAGGRSWVAAFRSGRGFKSTEIYRPSALRKEFSPVPKLVEHAVMGWHLVDMVREHGAISLKDFRYDAVRAIVAATHKV